MNSSTWLNATPFGLTATVTDLWSGLVTTRKSLVDKIDMFSCQYTDDIVGIARFEQIHFDNSIVIENATQFYDVYRNFV